jgi:aminopeptidase N
MTAEFKITVPSRFSVLCNGELISERVRGAGTTGKKRSSKPQTTRTTYHYKLEQKLPSYLVTLVVGEFERIQDRDAVLPSGRRVPVSYWVPRNRVLDGKRAFSETPRMIELFSSLLGFEYPYSRYTQVVVSDFIFGGMENTTATTMNEYILLDERAALDVDSYYLVAHELAHQWFGDWVTCRDWPHAWLNEGFATYFEHLEREDRLDKDEYLVGVESDLRAYLHEASGRYSRPVVCRDYGEPIDLFDRHLYEKGALVLHLLRHNLGDKVFFRALGKYLQSHAASHVTTEDLRAVLEQEAGRSLDRFFDEWVFQAGHPSVKAKANYAEGVLSIRFEQTQKRDALELNFAVEVMDAGGKLHRLATTSGTRHTSLSLELDKRPRYVAIDPELLLVGQLQAELATDWLQAQLQQAGSARVRRQAAQLIGSKPDFRSVQLLGEVLRKEREAWFVRTACAQALGALATDDALAELSRSIEVSHPKVRAAVAEALGEFRRDATIVPLDRMLDGEQSYLVEAAITRALGKTKHPIVKDRLLAQLEKSSWAQVVACAAIDGIAEADDTDRIELLKKYTQYGVPTRVRRQAVLALGRVGETKAVRVHLESLLDDRHPHFREDVAMALESLGDKLARGAINRRLRRETDGRVTRRLQLTARELASGETRRELDDKVTKLERELNELKAKVVELTAKKSARAGSRKANKG